ncbi:hypothetical protein P3L10_021172 [Capsicum annuum]
MMTYQIDDGVFEILTFAKNGKGENVHKVFAKGKKYSCGKWRNLHMPCSRTIEFCRIRGIEPKDHVTNMDSRTRLMNDMDITPACMTRKYSICKQTGHFKARCPR